MSNESSSKENVKPLEFNRKKLRIKESISLIFFLSIIYMLGGKYIDYFFAIILFYIICNLTSTKAANEAYNYYCQIFWAKTNWENDILKRLSYISENTILQVIVRGFGDNLLDSFKRDFRNSLFKKHINELYDYKDDIEKVVVKLNLIEDMINSNVFNMFALDKNKEAEGSIAYMPERELSDSSVKWLLEDIQKFKFALQNSFLEYNPAFGLDMKPIIWRFISIKGSSVNYTNEVNNFIYKQIDVAFNNILFAHDIYDIRNILNDLIETVQFVLQYKLKEVAYRASSYLVFPIDKLIAGQVSSCTD